MTLFNPWGLAALVTVPLIVMLYILKQKYKEVPVSSLYLWKKVLDNTKAHAPWQKLRKSILMVLQIIAMILLSLIKFLLGY